MNPHTRAATAVVQIADYLEDLKSRALSAPDTQAAIERGYLQPTEEIELRQLQASYWQCRNALFEIIQATQEPAQTFGSATPDPTPENSESTAADFLTAFTAAAVLVDAALFIRERYHRAKSIRQKLDEPDPMLGTPAHMYETIQHSLTRPANVWQLLLARRAYQQGRTELAETLPQRPYRQLLALADRRLPRLSPGVSTYLRTRLHVWGRFFTNRLRYQVLGQGLFYVQRYVSLLLSEVSVSPGHQPCLPPHVRDQLLPLLCAGDVLVVRKEYAATNYFLPGYWPHAALYLGQHNDLQRLGIESHPQVRRCWPSPPAHTDPASRGPLRVLEALKDGVRLRSVESPLASDSIVVLRPQIKPQHLAEGLTRALAHEGKPYDFDFDFTCSHRLVCTEVVYRAYQGLGGIDFPLRQHAGRTAMGAEGLMQMALQGCGLQPAALYSPADAPTVLQGDQAMAIIEKRTPA